MTETKRYVLRNSAIVRNAVGAILEAGKDWTVTISPPKRSLDQNAYAHALFGQLAKSGMKWDGKERSADEWKILCVSAHAVATGEGAELVRGLEGELVNIRESTAKMTMGRSSSLIEYVVSFCSVNGVDIDEIKDSGLRWGGMEAD